MANDAFPCKYCKRVLQAQSEWKDHVYAAHKITGYPCDFCTEVFYRERDYVQHFDAAHKTDFNRHVCSFCGVSYKWFKFLVAHIKKKHQVETLMECDGCGEEFYNSLAFQQHWKLKHVAWKKFHKCKKCHRSFTAKSFLRMHDKFDHSERGPLLFKEYVLENLDLDSETLLEDSKKCLKCNMQFSSSVYLFKHFKETHFKKRYYQCCACDDAVYNTRAGLSIHLYYEHGFGREHKCDKCTTSHLTPPPKTDDRVSIKKELPIQSTLPPWSEKFIIKDIPADLELAEANDAEIGNLRSNIRNLFHLLATVTPSKLKSACKADAKGETFFSMKSFKSEDIGRNGRRVFKPAAIQYDKLADGEAKKKNRLSVAEEKQKQPCATAKDTNVNNVKQKLGKSDAEFQCHICKDKFGYRKALNAHIVRVHGFKGFPSSCRRIDKKHAILSLKCEQIENGNAADDAAQPTEDNKIDVKPTYNCHSNSMEFSEQLELPKHPTEEHTNDTEHTENEQIFNCPECSVALTTQSELETHMSEHTKQQDENAKKVCKVCKKHMKKTKTVYKCLKCGKRFAKRALLRRHLKKHHRVPQYKCTKCKASFRVADKLKQHTAFKHSETAALPILKIQKSKLSPIKLDKLPNILSNILTRNLLNGTLHNCKICNSYFPSKALLQRHIQWEHTKNVNLHKCGQCSQVLYSVEDLELHMAAAHNSEGPFKWKKQIAFNYEQQTDI